MDALKMNAPEVRAGFSRWLLPVFAMTCGASVANIYYAQPLLDAIASTFAINPAAVGLVVTLTQIGYAAGLIFIVPLGDLVDRRRLVIAQTLLAAFALAAIGSAPNAMVLFSAMVGLGLLAVVVQVLVALSASLAPPQERGRAVGFVTSGVVVGILAARFVAGMLADMGGWRTVYFASACLMLLMGFLLAHMLPRDMPIASAERYGAVLKSIPRLFLSDPVLRLRSGLAFLIFASFSTLWTGMVLPLGAEPFALSHTAIGLFGLAGLAGALAAGSAGRWADRGLAGWTTGLSLALLSLSWLPIGLLPASLVAFTLGVVLLDFAVQAVHVTNQSLIFARLPEARSRLVGGYMVFYSAGSALGAITSTASYAHFGWSGVSLAGAAFSGAAFLLWAFTRRWAR
ncbi:MFS transporter [Shinella zoogloeoides]|uniref:MFS transporter n=1 Tax=Shinella zoogloeoides TaxID=352475 RepID=UPI003C7711C5